MVLQIEPPHTLAVEMELLFPLSKPIRALALSTALETLANMSRLTTQHPLSADLPYRL